MSDSQIIARQIGHTTANSGNATILTVILGVLLLLAAIYALANWRKVDGRLIALLFLAGAGCSLLEPIFDVMGHLYIFGHGSPDLFTLAGRSIPLWAFAAHVVAWVFTGYVGYLLVTRGATVRQYITVAIVMMCGNLLLEGPATHLGLYSYWGSQPIAVFGTFPLVWAIINMGAGVVAGTVLGLTMPKWLTGWRILVVPVLVPSIVAGFLYMSGWPFFVLINQRGVTANPALWVSTLGALAAISLCFVYLTVIARVVCNTTSVKRARAERSPGWAGLLRDGPGTARTADGRVGRRPVAS